MLCIYKNTPYVFSNGYKTTRRYYKTVNVPEKTETFVQPVLTTEGEMGGNTFAVGANASYAYKAFDSSESSYCDGLNADCWLAWYYPTTLYITSLQWKSSSSGYMQRAGRLEYSDNNQNWTTAVTWTNSSSTNPFTIQVGKTYGHHKYWRLYFTQKGSSSGNSDVADVTITGEVFIKAGYSEEIEVTENDDWDRYEDETRLELQSVRIVKPFVQPVLTSNGTIGGNSFGCDQEAFYDSGDPSVEPPQYFFYLLSNQPHEWQINTVDVNKYYWGKFYNPNPLILSEIAFQNTQTIYAPEHIKIYGSKNNANWVQIGEHLSWPQNTDMTPVPLIGTQKAWKYFMVEVKPRDATAVMIGKMRITAKEVI